MYPGIDVVVQVASSANQYSPLSSTVIFLEPDGFGDYTIHNSMPAGENGWFEVTIPGSGNAITQTRAIAQQFELNPFAADNLDGIVEHVYFDGGFRNIDGQRDFALNVTYNTFVGELGLTDLDYFISEWSPRNSRGFPEVMNTGNANGIHYAHTSLEAFF